ncbi:M20 family peptidase [Archangium violaceum]|uniref:M20 family peptidase n=1 Tax=Archangium violaceum TaxID=83451 RepID=UPI00194F4DFB|nr:M20 family peptidase [Archangium violaceum]QRN95240.1 M20 family peptidase [Archangium violaceum]
MRRRLGILKWVGVVLGGGLLLLVAVGLIRALSLESRQVVVEPLPPLALAPASAEHLAGVLRYRTISLSEGPPAAEAFQGLHRYLAETFPLVHQHLAREVVADHSLLYTWKGSDSSLPPLVLLAHQDVVPVEPSTEGRWTHPPFEGRVADGFVWGRGAMDDKSRLVAQLEAVEALLAEGVVPRRTVYLAFGHDEETHGEGARALAALLASRGVKAELVLDEGQVVTRGIVPGVTDDVALIGIAEKGGLSVELFTRAGGGHSSMPPPQTTVGVIAGSVSALERHPLPARLEGPARDLFAHLAPEMPFSRRLAFANLWLFRPLVLSQLTRAPSSNALVRTTTAATRISGGVKDNVLPSEARAVVNFRLLPGDSVEEVLAHVRATVNDARVEVRALPDHREASPSSPTSTEAYRALARTIRRSFPSTIVAPTLVVGGTDSRFYSAVSANVYRFSPMVVTPEDLERFHGTDERLSVDAWLGMVRFYRELLSTVTGAEAEPGR